MQGHQAWTTLWDATYPSATPTPTQPYTPVGILHRFGVFAGARLAKAQADATVESDRHAGL